MNCPDCRSPIINHMPTLIGSPICLPDCPPNVGCTDIIASPCVIYTGPNLPCTGLNTNATLNDLFTEVELLCSQSSASPSCCTNTVKISLTSAQILNLHSSPV